MKKSFTLIELIVVIAIIAILAAIIAPNAFKAIEKAKVVKMASDFKTLKKAWQAFALDAGKFPTEDTGIAPSPDYSAMNPYISETDLVKNVLNWPSWDGPYIEKTPNIPWGGEYRYDNDGDCYIDAIPGKLNGVSIFWIRTETSLAQSKYLDICSKVDAILDNNGDTVGNLRRHYLEDALLYLVDQGC